jgi:hypothetical protein
MHFPSLAKIKDHKRNIMKNVRLTDLALMVTEKVYLVLYSPGGVSMIWS